jgi:hypothetical protein
MRRGFVLAAATLVGGLLAAPTVESAPRPRFTVSIEGTQRFEWTLDATRDSRGGPVPCGYRGSGRQVITFRTARPVAVVVPKGEGSTYTYGGQPFFPVAPGPRKRLIPLVGQESRTYQALQAPAAGTCQNVPREQRKYFTDCGGTNPFLPNAGVVVMRYKRPRGHSQSVLARAGWKPGEREKAMMYAPVDVLLFERQPAQCGLLLFDVRNTYISQLLTVGQYRTLAGAPFERRRTNVLHSSGVVRGCVDPFGSTETGAVFQSCDRPMRPGSVTGEITTTWKLTFRRAR